jgi:NAD(P)-dependent dehydrogenase (short-subunit alcohol dehydrogenase family)
LAQRGFGVVTHSYTGPEDAVSLAEEIARLGGVAAAVNSAGRFNAAGEAGIEDAVARAQGPLSVLVDAAAVDLPPNAGPPGPLLLLAQDSFGAHMDRHVLAPVRLAQTFARHIGDAPSLAIVTVIEGRAQDTQEASFLGAIARAAAVAAVDQLARALAPRVRVNGVVQMGDPPTASVAAVCYLLEAEAVTGQILHIDGPPPAR